MEIDTSTEFGARVSLSFNGTRSGADVVVLSGDAWIDTDAPPANAVPAYIDKYAEGLRSNGMTADDFTREHSVPIRVRPTSLRGF